MANSEELEILRMSPCIPAPDNPAPDGREWCVSHQAWLPHPDGSHHEHPIHGHYFDSGKWSAPFCTYSIDGGDFICGCPEQCHPVKS